MERGSPTPRARLALALDTCHEWDSNPVSQNLSNLSHTQDRLNLVHVVGTARIYRAEAAWVRIPRITR